MKSRSTIPPLLSFDEPWRTCSTRQFDFVKAMNHDEVENLEWLRTITSMRTDALEGVNQRVTHLREKIQKYPVHLYIRVRSAFTLCRIEAYSFHLRDLQSKVAHNHLVVVPVQLVRCILDREDRQTAGFLLDFPAGWKIRLYSHSGYRHGTRRGTRFLALC